MIKREPNESKKGKRLVKNRKRKKEIMTEAIREKNARKGV